MAYDLICERFFEKIGACAKNISIISEEISSSSSSSFSSSSFSHSRSETLSDRVTWKEEVESGAPWLKCSPSVAIALAPQDTEQAHFAWETVGSIQTVLRSFFTTMHVVRLHVWSVFSIYVTSHSPTFQCTMSSATRMAWMNSDCKAAANSKGKAFHKAQSCVWKDPSPKVGSHHIGRQFCSSANQLQVMKYHATSRFLRTI